jgi:hypothetical protein
VPAVQDGVKSFLADFDRAMIVADANALRAAFAANAHIELVGPPPDSRRLVLSVDDMVAGLLEDSERADYGRHRTVEHIGVDSAGLSITAESSLDDFFRDAEGDNIYILYRETVTMTVRGGELFIVDYLAIVPEVPKAF